MYLTHFVIDGREAERSQHKSSGIERDGLLSLEKDRAVMSVTQRAIELELTVEGGDELIGLR